MKQETFDVAVMQSWDGAQSKYMEGHGTVEEAKYHYEKGFVPPNPNSEPQFIYLQTRQTRRDGLYYCNNRKTRG